MAGRIRDEDIAAVRERSKIEDIIGEHVALRNAGGGNLKGLCPFHDEKSPSLQVSPSKRLFHCFGCQVGGDVIRFVERLEHLSFVEAVESLADRSGIQLRYVEGGATQARHRGERPRLIEAHKRAAAFYADQLRRDEARPARDFLAARGFDTAAASTYGCGYAPAEWDVLTKHLLSAGFTQHELVTGGLAKQTDRGSLIDRFHRRLLWPIRDVSGDVVGFGARRIHDDDRIEAKYLNTPETPIYKKSQLLYGIDLAKKEIARRHQAVIVEGYTDVMACHLAGVPTAVASCGTAFGGEHVAVLRRLLMDSGLDDSEVVFTFDGDAAGRKAAERAFGDDDKFLAQTFVAIEPTGLDPCELRLAGGDAAVRELVARRRPLLDFVLESMADRLGLGPTPGSSDEPLISRQASLIDRAVPLLARLKRNSELTRYAQRVAGYVGDTDPNELVRRVQAHRRGDRAVGPDARAARGAEDVDPAVRAVEREVLKVAVQQPGVAGPSFDALEPDLFAVPAHRSVREAVGKAGGVGAAGSSTEWVEMLEGGLTDDADRSLLHALAIEPLNTRGESDHRYADAVIAGLQEIAIAKQVAVLKARLQRLNPVEQPAEYGRLFTELITAERHRISLRERAIGGG